jgi:hypothetical protein
MLRSSEHAEFRPIPTRCPDLQGNYSERGSTGARMSANIRRMIAHRG